MPERGRVDRLPGARSDEADPRPVLLVGLGSVGLPLLELLLLQGLGPVVVLVRDTEAGRRRANLAALTAYQVTRVGGLPAVVTQAGDLYDAQRTADLVARVNPRLVVAAACVEPVWRTLRSLGNDRDRLTRLGLGVWLPHHLVPVHALMKAVRLAGWTGPVFNASAPDMTHAMLAARGLVPTVGIGSAAHPIPSLTLAASRQWRCGPEEVGVRLIAGPAACRVLQRDGRIDGPPMRLDIRRQGHEPVSGETVASIARQAAAEFRRPFGPAGAWLTAASGVSLIRAWSMRYPTLLNLPGPQGLIGGYPVRVGSGHLALDLPAGLSRTEAAGINAAALAWDGIASIDSDGTVGYTDEAREVMLGELGYDCPRLTIDDAPGRSAELVARVAERWRQEAPQ